MKKRNFYFAVFSLVLSGFCLWIISPEHRLVVLPLLVMMNTALFFFFTIFSNRKGLPLFEVGVVCMVAIAAYSMVPLLMFLAQGGHYNNYSSVQLLALHPTFAEMGDFAWYYVIYIVSFALVYLFFTRRAHFVPKEIAAPSNAMVFGIVGAFMGLSFFFLCIKYFWGVDFNRSYLNVLFFSSGDNYNSLSLLSRQILQNLFQIKMLAMLALLIIFISKWHKKSWRYVLMVWLTYELFNYIFNMGSRTQIMMVGLAFILLYHRLVYPLTFKRIFFLGAGFFCAFILFGLLRGGDSLHQRVDFWRNSGNPAILSANEFETVFAGTYDLDHMEKKGIIGEAPWQVQLSDILFLIPSQILPVNKLDPQVWYLDHSQNPGYFMFNPIAQSIVGLGRIQLIINGALLAVFFAFLHRWYIKNSWSIIVTLFYLFLTVFSYYTIRSSSFGFLYRIQFHFLPYILLVWSLQGVFRLFYPKENAVVPVSLGRSPN